jgi:PleD family two-component response regulator
MANRTTKTSTTSTTGTAAGTDITMVPAAQRVVIVNGGTHVMALVRAALGVGRYEIVIVESNDHAYSHIRRVQPLLVILCTRIEDREGFQILSMLKLDERTRRIPVLTYTTEHEGQESEEDRDEDALERERIVASTLALPMN